MIQPTVSKDWRKTRSLGLCFSSTRSTPPCCNNTIYLLVYSDTPYQYCLNQSTNTLLLLPSACGLHWTYASLPLCPAGELSPADLFPAPTNCAAVLYNSSLNNSSCSTVMLAPETIVWKTYCMDTANLHNGVQAFTKKTCCTINLVIL